ncbi:Uncharacterized protein ToN1_27990 [Aromatoleum petrolei]|nr:Uncharacterized protein ToN1_27990 [Aromatoleum petrolei]
MRSRRIAPRNNCTVGRDCERIIDYVFLFFASADSRHRAGKRAI